MNKIFALKVYILTWNAASSGKNCEWLSAFVLSFSIQLRRLISGRHSKNTFSFNAGRKEYHQSWVRQITSTALTTYYSVTEYVHQQPCREGGENGKNYLIMWLSALKIRRFCLQLAQRDLKTLLPKILMSNRKPIKQTFPALMALIFP